MPRGGNVAYRGWRLFVTRRTFLGTTARLAALPAVGALIAACAPAAPTATPAPAKPAAGQSQGQATAPSAASKPAAKPRGDVVFWFPWEDRAEMILKEHKAAQPDINLKFELGEFDSNTKTMAALAAGNPPDISFLGRWQTCDLAVRNAIYPLDDRIREAKSFKWDQVWGRLQKDSTAWGKIWIVPYSTDTRSFFYNTDLMAEAGLNPEKPPKTWADLVDQSTKATKKDASGKIDQIGYTPTFGNPPTFLTFYSMLWMLGSDIANADRTKVTLQEKGKEAMTMVKDLMDKQGGYEAASAFTKGLTLGQGIDAFMAGKVVFAMHTNVEVLNIAKYKPDLKYKLQPGVTHAPQTEPFNYDGGGGFFYFKKGKNYDGAWETTEFLMSSDFYLRWADSVSFMPTLKPVAEQWAKKVPQREIFVATADTVRWIPIVVGTLDMLSHVTKMWDDVMFGKEPDIDKALDTAAKQIQMILDKHNSYPPPAG
jgi:multiple sugar transport system substrate-binding protein